MSTVDRFSKSIFINGLAESIKDLSTFAQTLMADPPPQGQPSEKARPAAGRQATV